MQPNSNQFSILVCFKVSADLEHITAGEVKAICEGSQGLDQFKRALGYYDEAAMEMGLRLRDQLSELGIEVQVTALTAGVCAKKFFQHAFAVRMDKVVHLQTDSDLSFAPNLVAAGIAGYVRNRNTSLILMGMQSVPGDNGLTPYLTAGMLGWACASSVVDLDWDDQGLKITGQRESSRYEARICTPAVLSVGNTRHPYLRVPTLKETLAVSSRKPEIFQLEDLAVRMSSPTNRDQAPDELICTWKERSSQMLEGEDMPEKLNKLLSLIQSDGLRT